jgi:hypothetical protein
LWYALYRQAEEFAWTTVVNKKKIQKELKKLRKLAGLEEEAPVTITKASVDVSDEYFGMSAVTSLPL